MVVPAAPLAGGAGSLTSADSLSGVADRTGTLRSAVRISALSVVWSGAVGGIAVASAVSTGSLAMLGFGVDAVIDAAASVALIWRFIGEARHPSRAAQVERTAEVVVGCALITLSAYLTVASIRSLLEAHSPVASDLAIVVLVASVVVLPPIALIKRRIARELKSGALRADSVLTTVAAVLGVVSLAGLALAAGQGWWWADALAAMVVAAVVVREGLKSIAFARPQRG